MRSPRKSTAAEAACAWFLSFGVTTCGLLYVYVGGRGWVCGALGGLLLLIAVVAGVAER